MKNIINRSITVNKASLRETLLQSREQKAERVEDMQRKLKETGVIDKLQDIRRKSLTSQEN
jgi:hypothetical protein